MFSVCNRCSISLKVYTYLGYNVKSFFQTETPDREIYRDPDVVRAEEYIDDSKVAKESHTASKMLNKFRQMEENMTREPENLG